MKFKNLLYGTTLACISVYNSLAQQVKDSTSLEEIYLQSSSVKGELKKTPASVSLLNKTELQRSSPTLTTQSFNRVPGVYTQAGALNTNRITIRGIGARAQYGTNRVKAYFNEIPLSSGDGETVINDIDLDALERVEIIKGPNSSLYGSGLGGVIHLISADPEKEKTFAKISTDIGSYQLLKKSISAGFATQKTSIFANYNHLEQEGYKENSDYDRKSFHLNGKLYLSEKSNLSFLGNFTRLKAFIPSSISFSAYEEDPRQAAFTWKSAKGYESYIKLLLGLSYHYQFSNQLEQTMSIFTNYKDAYEPRPFDILQQETLNWGARSRFDYQHRVFDIPLKSSLGAEFLQENYEGSNFENLYEDFPNQGSVEGDRIANVEQDRNYINAFAQIDFQVTPKLNLIGGLNVNSTNYTLTDFFTEANTEQRSEGSFKTIFAPRFAVLYELTQQKNVYLNVSKGFSTPTVDETLTPDGRINTSLQPEIGWNYELGFKGNWTRNFYTEIALYTIQVNDLLVAERVGNDQYVGINAGKTDHNGIEILLQYTWDISPSIQLLPFVSAEFNDYEFDEFIDEGDDFSGNELTGVPNEKINVGIDAIFYKNLRLFSNALFVSKIPLNDENSAYSENYKVIDLKASYRLNILENFDVHFNLGVNNLFNEAYAVSILPNAIGFGGNEPRYFYPGNDRNFFGGVSLKYSIQ